MNEPDARHASRDRHRRDADDDELVRLQQQLREELLDLDADSVDYVTGEVRLG